MAEEPKKKEEEPRALAPETDMLAACCGLAEELTAAAADDGATWGSSRDVGDCADVLAALALHRIACALEALQTEATETLIEDAVHMGPMAPTAVATLTRGAKPRGG